MDLDRDLEMLAGLLHAAVHAGASVSFILPFSIADARAFWCDKVLPEVQAGGSPLFVARSQGSVVGTVQLELAWLPNQRHRAEVRKLLVHPAASPAPSFALEGAARAEGRTLLTLDTRTGDQAEPLYLSLGYIPAGVIPRYSRAPASPELEATSLLFKEL